MNKRFITALLGAFTLLLGHSASYASTGSVSNFQLGYTDLTPNDGQAAGFSITHSISNMGTQIATDYSGQMLSLYQDDNDDHVLDASDILATSKSILRSSGDASAIADIPNGLAGVSNVAAIHYYYLNLLPHTALNFSGQLFTDAAPPHPTDRLDEARATVVLQERFPGSLLFSAEAQSSLNHGVASTTSAVYDQGWHYGNSSAFGFNFTQNNDSDTAMQLFLRIETHALNLTDTPPAVPEPASYLMFGVGMAALGTMARRRRQA